MTEEPVFLTHEPGQLLECPVWDAANERLLWCDIPVGEIHSLRPRDGARRTWTLPQPVCSFGLARSGRLVVAMADAVYLFDLESGVLTHLATLLSDYPRQRLNDGKVGPDGAFWVGAMDDGPDKKPISALYRVSADGGAERKLDGIIISNGLAWSADGTTMFHCDSRGPWLDRWRFDPATGAMSDRVRLRHFTNEDGRPDGAATDMEGGYWSAGVSAGCLNRFDRDGNLLSKMQLPVSAPTMPCFGGPDLRTLFVTSLRRADDGPNAMSGRLISLEVDVAGVPVPRFAD